MLVVAGGGMHVWLQEAKLLSQSAAREISEVRSFGTSLLGPSERASGRSLALKDIMALQSLRDPWPATTCQLGDLRRLVKL